ncbi:2-phosphosulfolactate phosphatase [Radiobacillus deserti]|uniref:Probable 2-phosphosulfolactate phosphatase n=1 Tax=Radiobacillus deserti TaxID=2594883 RepID=A0A516KDQ1_9BACI|nr:2-phosphosulfolactate phosphatase [Radiobacillus deserti]QDP39528.1 2-phosphosulfolactate phosphatase [Radiobacillus deserti]
MEIHIFQGRTTPKQAADTTIVIDVLRAFTVAHYAFLKGVNRIFLAESTEQAFQWKAEHPSCLLAGERDGLPIEDFDLDNSPYHMQEKQITGKTLVQKTTNGVRATLNSLASSTHVYVTGFTNARKTAEFVKAHGKEGERIHIIASHPNGEDDLACAEYIKSIIEDSSSISEREVIDRIIHSRVARKFLDNDLPAFPIEDIYLATKSLDSNFVMRVNKKDKLPTIERVMYDGVRLSVTG